MKKLTLLFLFLCSFLSVFSQIVDDSTTIMGQHIRMKDGRIYYVKKPVLLCDSTAIFMIKNSNVIRTEKMNDLDAISKNCSPRWITKDKFYFIGTGPVFGYILGLNVFFPPGMGFFIYNDLIIRNRIKKMYKHARNVI